MSKCSICIGFKNDAIIYTECNHTFHSSCFNIYIKEYIKTTTDVSPLYIPCPNCRYSNNILNLFKYPNTRKFDKNVDEYVTNIHEMVAIVQIIEKNVLQYDMRLHFEYKLFYWFVLYGHILKYNHSYISVSKYFLINFLYVRLKNHSYVDKSHTLLHLESETEIDLVEFYFTQLQTRLDTCTKLMEQMYNMLK